MAMTPACLHLYWPSSVYMKPLNVTVECNRWM
jgi:hypothetical protein